MGGGWLFRSADVLLPDSALQVGDALTFTVCPFMEKKCITFMHLFPMFQLFYCLAHLHSFIYLLMWHFCYTEHVSIYRTIMLVFFLNNHFII